MNDNTGGARTVLVFKFDLLYLLLQVPKDRNRGWKPLGAPNAVHTYFESHTKVRVLFAGTLGLHTYVNDLLRDLIIQDGSAEQSKA